MSQFRDFDLADPLNAVLEQVGFTEPTPVQAKAIPVILGGKDILASAQTGTGKTAAFALPLISKMLNGWDKAVLIVAPTRELAEQIGQVLLDFTVQTPNLRTSVVIGGASYPRQIRSLQAGPSFVVGTPGRLIDQVRLGHLSLKNFGALVIDEADRLLDMGFEPQMIELVSQMPTERQSLLFSATLPDEILSLAGKFLRAPVRIAIGSTFKPVQKIRQDVIRVTTDQKDRTLIQEIDKVAGSVIVFTKTKFKTEKLAIFLEKSGHDVTRIHGDRTQAQRSAAIRDFRDGKARILVATDIAARGIDIAHIQHVINYDLPTCPEDYIHRIGRTARAGQDGHSIAFVTPEENIRWAQIHKLIYGRYPDEFPRPGGGMSGRKAPLPAKREGGDGRRAARHIERAQARANPGGPRVIDKTPKARPEQVRNPRRQQELLAEKFLKDERRQQLPQAANAAKAQGGNKPPGKLPLNLPARAEQRSARRPSH